MAIIVNDTENTILVTGDEAQAIINELSQSVSTVPVTQVAANNVIEQVITTDSQQVTQTTIDGVEIVVQSVADSVVKTMYLVDHGILDGLTDDDHPQYLTNARGDQRYTPISHISGLDTNPHGLNAVDLPGLSPWGTLTAAADATFIGAQVTDDAVAGTKIISLPASKIATGILNPRIPLNTLVNSSREGTVLNDNQLTLAAVDDRVQFGFIPDVDGNSDPITYLMRHCNGFPGDSLNYRSNFSIDSAGNVSVTGRINIIAGAGIANFSDAGALASRDVSSYFSATAPLNPIEGDIWYNTSQNNSPARFNGVDWDSVKDADIAIALGAIDGKTRSYYQPEAPTGLTAADNGDLWFDTDNGNRMSYYAHPVWLDAQDSGIAQGINAAASAQATADGKITTYSGTSFPIAIEGLGDLFYHTTQRILYRAIVFPVSVVPDPLEWEVAANNFDDTNLLTDSAGLGTTALWGGVTGVGKPDDYADVTNIGGANYVLRGLTSPNSYSGANVAAIIAGKSQWGISLGDSTSLTQIVQFDLAPLDADTDFVVSFWAVTDIPGATFILDLFPDTLPEYTITVTTTPQYITRVFNSADATAMATAILRMFKTTGSTNPTSVINIYDIKFEWGTQATDWTPYNPATDKADATKGVLEAGAIITDGGIIMSSGGAIKSLGMTDESVDVTAGVWLGYNGADYTFGVGDGADQYIKYTGSAFDIGRKVKVNGADAYNNNNIFYHTHFDSVDGWIATYPRWDTGSNPGAYFWDGGTNASYLRKGLQHRLTQATWARGRRFKLQIYPGGFTSTQFFEVYTGSPSGHCVGFRVVYDTGYSLYAYCRRAGGGVRDVDTGYDLTLTYDADSATIIGSNIEVEYIPNVAYRLYLNDVMVYEETTTSYIPLHTTAKDADHMIYGSMPAGYTGRYVRLGELVFLQDAP